MERVAIFVDGAFYKKRAQKCLGYKSPVERAKELEEYCRRHLKRKDPTTQEYVMNDKLYRVFYYDCPPMDRLVYHPFLHRNIVFNKNALYIWMNDFLDELKKKRKFALRLGNLATVGAHYLIKGDKCRALCDGKIKFEDLKEDDWKLYGVDQKGVDMRIGIDIASLAYKKLVDKMILISGDSDFVPAAKLARREGDRFCS